MRQGAIEELERLAKCERRLGFLGCRKACSHGFVEASGSKKVAG
jgi:hypothetical protein